MLKRLLITLFSIICTTTYSQFVASDLSYTCQGGGKYQIKLEVYTECSTDGNLLFALPIPFYINSPKLNVNLERFFFDAPTSVDQPVRLFCDGQEDNCSNPSSPNRGLRKSVYYKTIDLSSYNATDDWQVYFILDFKDDVFTHLVSPATYPHMSSTNINTTITGCNSSVFFSEKPILKSCLNQKDTINLGISDPDGDVLRYSLATPITLVNKTVVDFTYQSGFSFQKPLNLASNLSVTSTGSLILNGTTKNDVGTVDLIIDEYRNNVKIASTRRNLQINIFDCANKAPVISDFVNATGTNKKQITVCSGDTLKKNVSLIKITDPDANNKIRDVQITPRDPRLNGYFTVNYINGQKEAEVFVNDQVMFSTATDVTILVDIKGTDDGCPTDLSTIKTFSVLVKARPVFDFGVDEAFISCEPKTVLKPSKQTDLILNDANVPTNLSGSAPFTYKWSVWHIDPNNFMHIRDSVTRYNAYTADSLIIKKERGITVTVTDKNGCKTSDSIYIKKRFNLDYDVKHRCFDNDSTEFTDFSYSDDPESKITSRKWYFGANNSIITSNKTAIDSFSTSLTEFSKKYCEKGLFPVRLVVTTEKGCKDTADSFVRIHQNPEAHFDVTVNCLNEMNIDDVSEYFDPTTTAPGNPPIKKLLATRDFTSYKKADAKYYVTKVHSGLDSNYNIHINTYGELKVVCDSIFITLHTDSSAGECTVKDITAPKYYKFNYHRITNKTYNKIFSTSLVGDKINFEFKKFEFNNSYTDTTLLAEPTLIVQLDTNLLHQRKYNVFPLSNIQDKTTNVFKLCKQFVKEDTLVSDILIPEFIGGDANDYTFPDLNFIWEKQGNRIQKDSGLYMIRLDLVTQADCQASVTQEVRIYPEPKLAIGDISRQITVSDIVIENCLKADTAFFVKQIYTPNGPFTKFHWKYISDPAIPHEDIIDDTMSTLSISDSVRSLGLGKYYIYAKDQRGCDDTATVTLVSNLKPNFSLIPSCTSDSVIFFNLSDNAGGPKITNNVWTMTNVQTNQDIATFTDNNNKFTKLVSESADIRVTLTTKDSLNCNRNITNTIYKSKFNDVFAFPDAANAAICATDIIKTKSIELVNTVNHIDSIVWNLGDGRKLIQTQVNSQSSIDAFTFAYNTDSIYNVSFKVYYNSQRQNIPNNNGQIVDSLVQPSCVYNSGTLQIGIKPEFKGKLFKFRNCTSDSSEFVFEKDPKIGDNTIKVTKVDWTVTDLSNIPEPQITFPMTRQDAYSFKEKFYKARSININFVATDQNGCVFRDNVNSSIDETALPVIEKLDTVCSGSNSTIRIRNTNKSPEGLTRRVFDYGVDYLGKRVVFAPYVSSTGIETVIYKFPDVGQLPFKVYGIVLGNDTSLIDGRQNECRAVLDTSLFVRPIPQIKFEANPVCARQDTTFFKNLTRFRHNSTDPKDSIIVSYLWDFGDGSAKSNLKNPSHVFTVDGNKMVSLTATTASGCVATDTLEVGVKNSPKAYFKTSKDSSLLDFTEPIEFINLTTGEYTKALWEFGDGAISNDLYNTSHQYDSLFRFNVTLTVWNNQNECPDSYTKVAELRPILLLPNVFSPNNDGQNDQLFLIYRLIEELEEFKIYNRWGQVVFDANGDLKARWDGTYKGTDQEIGSYVAYVKAKGKHGINYNFKQNITLIR